MRRSKTLLAIDSKYAPSAPCRICGAPTRSLATKCVACLNKAYLKEELGFARNWLGRYPETLIEIGHDRRNLMHLVCLRTPRLAWCGVPVTQKRAKRKLVKTGELPADLCGPCLQKLQDVRL